LFDGVFLQRSELAGEWDVRVWVEAPFDVTVPRAVSRDAGQTDRATVIRTKYERRYVPGQLMYIARCRPRDVADVLVDNVDLENPRAQYRKLKQAV